MSNSDGNNSRLTSMNTNSASSSIINSTPTSPPTSSICSTSTSPLSITPRRIVKAKRSLVWRYFNDMKDDVLNVECVLCSSVITRKSTSTSDLLHHIQIQHNVEYQHLNKVMKSQTQISDSTTRLPLTSDRSIHLTKLIADLIIYNFLPLSVVESPHLQAILAEAEPSYTIPRRKYFTNNVLQEMYSDVQQKVYEELQQAPGICLTTDICTSQANQAYMTITAHFIDLKNKKIKNFVLETKEFTGNHTAERIVESLERWIGCIDHLINLSVNDIIRKQDEVMLEPCEAATRKLASDSLPTLSIVLPVVTTLITSLEDLSTDSSFIKKMKDVFCGSIQERFTEIYENKLVLLCTVLDPRWKDFTFLQRSSYQNHVETLSLLNKLQTFETKQLAYLY
ncbi:unnamed protein product [Rotaria sp. Silwood2]|nr:unnamed protein product [Rotaria sp. Silwood2]